MNIRYVKRDDTTDIYFPAEKPSDDSGTAYFYKLTFNDEQLLQFIDALQTILVSDIKIEEE